MRVIEVVVEAAKKRVPVIAGTGLELDARGDRDVDGGQARVGADGLLLVTPYYNRPGQEHLYRHFKAIIAGGAAADASSTTSPAAPPATCCPRRSRASPSCPRWSASRRRPARRCARRRSSRASATASRVLSGDDATAFPLFALGARGVISVVSNVAPALMSAMWDAAAAGDWNKARAAALPAAAARRGAVRRGEPDPGQGRAGDDGAHDRRDPAAALPAGGAVPRQAARAARRAGPAGG